MALKVLTANRLLDGACVWLGVNGEWNEELKGAFIARHEEAVASLEEIGKKAVQDNILVDVALIDVEEKGDLIWPVRLRERIRSGGPSVAYGYDAENVRDTIAA